METLCLTSNSSMLGVNFLSLPNVTEFMLFLASILVTNHAFLDRLSATQQSDSSGLCFF